MGQGQSASAKESENVKPLKIDASDSFITDVKMRYSTSTNIIPISEYIKRDKRSRNFQKSSTLTHFTNAHKEQQLSNENQGIHSNLNVNSTLNPSAVSNKPSKQVNENITTVRKQTSKRLHSKKHHTKKNEQDFVKEIYRNDSFVFDEKEAQKKKKNKVSKTNKKYDNNATDSEINVEKNKHREEDNKYEASTHHQLQHHYDRKHYNMKRRGNLKNFVMQTNVSCSIYPTVAPSYLNAHNLKQNKEYTNRETYKTKIQSNKIKILPREIHQRYSAILNELQGKIGTERGQVTITEIIKAPNIKNVEYNYSNVSKPISSTRLEYIQEQHRKINSPKQALENWKNIHTLKHHRKYKITKNQIEHSNRMTDNYSFNNRYNSMCEPPIRNFQNTNIIHSAIHSEKCINSGNMHLTPRNEFHVNSTLDMVNSAKYNLCKHITGRKSTWVQDKHLNWHKIILEE